MVALYPQCSRTIAKLCQHLNKGTFRPTSRLQLHCGSFNRTISSSLPLLSCSISSHHARRTISSRGSFSDGRSICCECQACQRHRMNANLGNRVSYINQPSSRFCLPSHETLTLNQFSTRPFSTQFYCDRKSDLSPPGCLDDVLLGSIPWHEAVSAGEKLVAYPLSLMGLRFWLSDEMANVAVNLRKLIGTNHPLVKLAKDTFFEKGKPMQTRGLLILLLSKASGRGEDCSYGEADMTEGIHNRQRDLAEITEMIHMVTKIHSSIVQLSSSSDGGSAEDKALANLRYGNKMAILSGDYLLAKAAMGLAKLRNTKVVGVMASAISDLMKGDLVPPKDKAALSQNELPNILNPKLFDNDHEPPSSKTHEPTPFTEVSCHASNNGLHGFTSPVNQTEKGVADSKVKGHEEGYTVKDWEKEVFYKGGALVAKSCMSCLLLSGHKMEVAQKGFEFGKYFILSKELKEELSHVDSQPKPDSKLSIVKIMKEAFSEVSQYEAEIHRLHRLYTQSAISALHCLHPSEARYALEQLVNAVPSSS